METNKIFNEALNLTPTEKAQLIELLSESLLNVDDKNNKLWQEEAERRIALLDANKIRTVSFNEILKQYN